MMVIGFDVKYRPVIWGEREGLFELAKLFATSFKREKSEFQDNS